MTSASEDTTPDALLSTPLLELHRSLGARMVPFAGYLMPLHYPSGVLKEHLHTRASAGFFDVSHMGQVELLPRDGDPMQAALALERLAPMDLCDLEIGRQRYGFFTNDEGGVLDDIIVARAEDRLRIVCNASRKIEDAALLRAELSESCEVELLERALMALQGPLAETVLARLAPQVVEMAFLDFREVDLCGARCLVSRSGYTGEDGFEISVPPESAMEVAQALLAQPEVKPIGLAARDSLRLEAGYCLYGADLDEETTPIEAGLSFAVAQARRKGGARPGGFRGDAVILDQIEHGAPRRRVGLLPDGRAPVRAGAPLFADDEMGPAIGAVTSGGFGPSLNAPIAMGYAPHAFVAPGQRLFADYRGKRTPLTVVKPAFVESRMKRS